MKKYISDINEKKKNSKNFIFITQTTKPSENTTQKEENLIPWKTKSIYSFPENFHKTCSGI